MNCVARGGETPLRRSRRREGKREEAVLPERAGCGHAAAREGRAGGRASGRASGGRQKKVSSLHSRFIAGGREEQA